MGQTQHQPLPTGRADANAVGPKRPPLCSNGALSPVKVYRRTMIHGLEGAQTAWGATLEEMPPTAGPEHIPMGEILYSTLHEITLAVPDRPELRAIQVRRTPDGHAAAGQETPFFGLVVDNGESLIVLDLQLAVSYYAVKVTELESKTLIGTLRMQSGPGMVITDPRGLPRRRR